MTWVKLDDQFFHNRKARSVGLEGRELFLASACYCAMQLNDGCFNRGDLPVIAALAQVEPTVADLLISHGLWHPEGRTCPKCRAAGQVMPVPSGHLSVHEFLLANKSREDVVSEREAAAERQRRSRESKKRHGVTRGVTHAVSSRAPSRPVPNDVVLTSSGNSRANGQTADDDELSTGVPDETWDAYAELRLRSEPAGKVKSPVKWKTTTARNAQVELADKAQSWWATFDITPRRLAECLVDDTAPRNAPRRQP